MALDREWIRSFPEFRQLTESLDLGISRQVPLHGTVLESEGEGMASLISTDPMFRLFPPLAGLSRPPFQKIMAGLLWLIVIAMAAAFLIHLQALRRAGQDRAAMSSWAAQIHELLEKARREGSELDLPHAHPVFREVAARLSGMLVREKNQASEIQDQLHQENRKVAELNQRLKKVAENRSAVFKQRFLSTQVSESIPGMKKLVDQIQSCQEDLDDVVSRGLTSPANELSTLISGWQRELQKTSPRKFLRSLSERETPSGSNELESNIGFLIRRGQDISTQAINLSLMNKKIRQKIIRIHHCLGLWEKLDMQATDRGNPVEAIRQAATMFDFSREDQGHQILIKIPTGNQEFYEDIPASVWGAVTYHLFHYLSWQNRQRKDVLGIRVSLMKQSRKPMLVFSPVPGKPVNERRTSNKSGRLYQERLDEIRDILSAWNIKPIMLPVHEGLQAIAIPTSPPGQGRSKPALSPEPSHATASFNEAT